MSDMMTFPETWEEFEKSYGFTDSEEVYTNGSRLIPSFRVKQWLDHEETKRQAIASSNCISRQDAINKFERWLKVEGYNRGELNVLKAVLYELRFMPPASTDLSTFSDKLWKIAYERGKKEGMQQLHDYQVEWLKSHDDLQLDPQLEEMIIRFLHDTTNCLLMERGEEN